MRTPPLPSPTKETDALGTCAESSSQPTQQQDTSQACSGDEMQLSSNLSEHVSSSRKKSRLNARVQMPESAYRQPTARKPLPTPLSKSFSAHSTPTPERTSPINNENPIHNKSRPKSAAPASNMSSYPFPNMRVPVQRGPPTQLQGLRSPNVTEIMERALSSGTPTPASFNFLPPGVGQEQLSCSNPEFPTPNLYDLSLLLNSEPGLEGFWANLVTIMTRCYKAERMSLSVPTDLTDLENTPWGQKASFHQAEDDTLSLTYFGEGGIGDDEKAPTESDDDDDQGVALNEGTEDYWSGSADGGENRRKAGDAEEDDETKDPGDLSFIGSEGPFSPITVDVSDLNTTDQAESPLPTPIDPSQDCFSDGSGGYLLQQPCQDAAGIPKGRVFPTLQPLNYEADALLDGAGVSRILQRGKVVVLSREYRDQSLSQGSSPETKKENPKWNLKTDTTNTTPTTPTKSKANLKISLDGLKPFSNSPPATPLEFVGKRLRGNQPKDLRRPGQDNPFLPFSSSHYYQQHHSHRHRESSTYDEYEQLVTSPWSQSPAASPAPKRDPSENPFFVAPRVDERSFSPDEKTPEFIPQNNVEAIGLESAWTVIHIPLIHPTVYRPFNSPANKSQHQETRPIGNNLTVEGAGTVANTPAAGHSFSGFERKAPIAILSILSSAIPYPKNLIQSLKHLAPIMATSYSLAHGYTSVMNQLKNLREEALAHPHGQLDSNSSWQNYPSDSSASVSESASSNYVSAQNSQMASPGYTTASDSLQETNAFEGGFYTAESAKKPTLWPFSRQNSGGPGASDSAPKFPRKGRGLDELLNISEQSEQPNEDSVAWVDLRIPSPLEKDGDGDSTDSKRTISKKSRKPKPQGEGSSGTEQSATSKKTRTSRRRRGKKVGELYSHSVLHSHGADYSATFQTMNPTLGPVAESIKDAQSSPGSAYSIPPPSNRLLRTIIDAIPVHVFTAEPNTGETTWANARYLTYCGFPPSQLRDCVRESVHPDDREEHNRYWHASIHKGEPYSRQIRLRRFDGEYRWFMVRMVPLRDSKGGIAHWFGTNMDVHDQRSAEVNAAIQAEVAESESKYRSLANSSPQIVFAATAEQGITFANDQWLAYSGQTLEEALHLGFMDFVHPLERNKCGLPILNGLVPEECPEVPIDLTSDGKGVYSVELRLRNKQGDYRWHLVRCVSVETNFGTGEGMWFGTCTDINDQKLVQQKLKEANEAAHRAMESKTRFLANMSHEIRTPLIGISGMVNFLLDTPLNVEQLDYCHTISSSSDGLLTVINDILDLSKVEAGMMRLNSEWFRIHSLIEDANELLSTLAISKNLELNYIVEEDVPPIICGDRVRLRQVLLNVIGNAIKFTNQGEVFSKWSVLKDADVEKDEVMLQFECHDTGPGFDAKEAELMFKPFSQIDASSTRTHGGSGLGLVISRQLIELHGGMMHACSEKGKGATFKCTAKFKLPAEGSFKLANLPRSASQKDIEKLAGTYRRSSFSTRPESSLYDQFEPVTYNNDSPTSADESGVEESPTPPLPLTEEQQHHLTQIIPPMSLIDENQTDVMRLNIPSDVVERAWNRAPSTTSRTSRSSIDVDVGRALSPPMFSILIVGEHKYSRMATAHHIRVTLPPSIPSQITEVSEYTECHKLITGEDPVVFTHIVINLPEASEIIELISQVLRSSIHALTTVIILTNPMQRTAIMEGCGSTSKKLETRVQFIYKPIKPSRFAIIFDPTQERDASTDRYRDTAQQVADNQKRVFSDMEKEVGGKGHEILLVEDNRVNQKVLLRFLHKAGLSVETASDGVECVEKVLSAGLGRFGLIICDLHMPRKDGFQACSEIRQWEKENKYAPVPIVALSANVMSDVAERCVAAGFSRYVTKPVDFKILGQTIKELLNENIKRHARHTAGVNLEGIPSPSSAASSPPLPQVKEEEKEDGVGGEKVEEGSS